MPLSLAERAMIAVLRELPLHALTRAAGRLASLRLPPALQRLEIRAFAAAVGADLGEAAQPVGAYPTLLDFFTRALADGARPVDPAWDALVSPCDGRWGAAGPVEDGTLFQLKGRPYSLAALLGSEEDARRYEGGCYATLYLAPRDYHRFHAPCDVRVRRARYLPGRLWPVNRLGVEGVPGVFAENERICAFLSPPRARDESLCIVAVGATCVGRIRLSFDDLTTESGAQAERVYPADGIALEKGEEWGRFELGSTLVLLTAAGTASIDPPPPGTLLRLGTRIGKLL
jgi:phosphatidylserine decarboxylase